MKCVQVNSRISDTTIRTSGEGLGKLDQVAPMTTTIESWHARIEQSP